MNLDFCPSFDDHDDLDAEFAFYSDAQLHSRWLLLIKTNMVLTYCESLIFDGVDGAQSQVTHILKLHHHQDWVGIGDRLPWNILLDLRQVEIEISECNIDRKRVIWSILSLVMENTILQSTFSQHGYYSHRKDYSDY